MLPVTQFPSSLRCRIDGCANAGLRKYGDRCYSHFRWRGTGRANSMLHSIVEPSHSVVLTAEGRHYLLTHGLAPTCPQCGLLRHRKPREVVSDGMRMVVCNGR